MILAQHVHRCLTRACAPGAGPSGVTPPTPPSGQVARLVTPATRTLLPAAVAVVTGRARTVAARAVPAGFTPITGAVSGRAGMVVFTVAAAEGRRWES